MKCKPIEGRKFRSEESHLFDTIHGLAEMELGLEYEKDGIVYFGNCMMYMKKEDVKMYDIKLELGKEFYYHLSDAQGRVHKDNVDAYNKYTWKVVKWHGDIAELKSESTRDEDIIFMYKDQFLPTKKEEEKKMIKIETRKEVNSMGVIGRKVISVSGLPRNKLPDLYLDNEDGVVVNDFGCNIYFSATYVSLLKKDKFYSEEKFQNALEKIQKAGDLLHSINKELRAKRKAWNGEETFVI